MAKYELMVLLPGDLTEKEALKHLETVKGYITENGGEIVDELIWGKRDLAYYIKKNDVGFYATYHFNMEDNEGLKELKSELRLDQTVIRELLIMIDEDYTFAEFEKAEKEAIKAKEEAMAKRKRGRGSERAAKQSGAASEKKATPKDGASAERSEDVSKEEVTSTPKAPTSVGVAAKKKSTSDEILDDPDLTL